VNPLPSRPNPAHRASLLNSAVAGVVDASSPQLTWVDAGLPDSQKRKTNPPTSPSGSLSAMTPSRGGARPIGGDLRAVDAGLRGLTPVNADLLHSPVRKTNPPASVGTDPSLTERQLAAARLLAWGRTTSQVAKELEISRQALWKWRRDPVFAGEVRRIHERISLRPPLGASRT